MSNDDNTQFADSSPAMRTTFPQQTAGVGESDTGSGQNPVESESAKVKFPRRIKHHGRVLAKIYCKSKSYPFYRVAAYVAGKRRMSSFATYSEARSEADKLVKDLAKGSQAAALRDSLLHPERIPRPARSGRGRQECPQLIVQQAVFRWRSARLGRGSRSPEQMDGGS